MTEHEHLYDWITIHFESKRGAGPDGQDLWWDALCLKIKGLERKYRVKSDGLDALIQKIKEIPCE